jgi:hypothetical protein
VCESVCECVESVCFVSVARAFVLSCFIKTVTEALEEKRVEKRCYMRKEVCEKGSGGTGGRKCARKAAEAKEGH